MLQKYNSWRLRENGRHFLVNFLEFFKKAPVRGSSYAENNALAVYCLNLFT